MTTAHDHDRVAALIEKWRAEADVSDALVDAGEITPQVAEHERGTAFASRLCADELEVALAVPVGDNHKTALAIAQRISASTSGSQRINAIREALLAFPAVTPLVRILAPPAYAEPLPSATQALASAGARQERTDE